jgi:hypothetical protein
MLTIKSLFFSVFVILPGIVSGQSFIYPKILREGKTLQEFIPADWKVVDSAKGDMDGNNNKEYAFIIRYKDSTMIPHMEDGKLGKFRTLPSILIIIFQYGDSGKFVLIEQNNKFATQQIDNNGSFPYTAMKINNGIFNIDFAMFYGPAAHRKLSYVFRYQNKKFVLIGADTDYFNESTREYEKTSVNFLSGKWSSDTGNGDSGVGSITWHRLPSGKLRPLSAFQEPEGWRVTNNLDL